MSDNRTAEKPQPKEKFSWNPFVRIADDAHAFSLAKDGGLVCVGLIALSYVLMVALVFFSGQSPYAAGEDAATTQTSHVVALAIAALLAWRIWARQPLWALWIVLAWIAVETAGKLMLVGSGGMTFSPFSFLINGLGLIAGVQAVRGGMWISKNRQQARRSAIKAGYDL